MVCLDLYLKLDWLDADSSFSILEVTRMTITRITRLIWHEKHTEIQFKGTT